MWCGCYVLLGVLWLLFLLPSVMWLICLARSAVVAMFVARCDVIVQGWESSVFHWNSGLLRVPRVILKIHLDLGRKFVCLSVHYNSEVLTPCALFYPNSVCPELARKCTVWKWPCVAHIHTFCGGLQARLWQAKISLWSFIRRFSQAAHRVARKESCRRFPGPHFHAFWVFFISISVVLCCQAWCGCYVCCQVLCGYVCCQVCDLVMWFVCC